MPRNRDDDRDDDRDDRPRRSSRRRDDDDEPRPSRRSSRDDDEEPRPSRRSSRDDDDGEDRPRRRSRRDYDDGPPAKQASVLGILALIGGIPSVAVNFIPCCGFIFGIVGGVITLILGIIGLVMAKGSQGRVGTGLPLAGTILGGIAILFSILWMIFFTVLAATAPTNRGGSTGTPVSPSDPVAASVTAGDLATEFNDNEVTANNKYQGKVVEVTGKVKQVTDSGGISDITVELDGSNFVAVDCNFGSGQRSSVSNLTTGSTVTIRGRCAGTVIFDVTLNDCIIMPGGPTKGPDAGGLKVTAPELAKAFADNPVAAGTKYETKAMEVTGTVTTAERDGAGVGTVRFNTFNGDVECLFGTKDSPGLVGVRPGQQLKVRGTCDGLEGGKVTLSACTLVK